MIMIVRQRFLPARNNDTVNTDQSALAPRFPIMMAPPKYTTTNILIDHKLATLEKKLRHPFLAATEYRT